FKTLETLKIGDTIYEVVNRKLVPQKIQSIQFIAGHVTVYNLQTDDPHTFFAHGIAVHNKGGCFAAGTMVQTPQGDIAIEKITLGQKVICVELDEKLGEASVQAIFQTRSEILELHAGHEILRTTEEHPIGLPNGDFELAGNLNRGEKILL